MPPLARLKALLFPTTDPLTRFRASIIRRKKLTSRSVSLLPYFRTFLILAGFLYLLALPWEGLGRKHYVSENALQPGQVNTYWNWADVHIADRYADDVARWSVEGSIEVRAKAIQDAFQVLGLPSATQEYSFSLGSSNQTLSGTNVYSILQAPKTDGAEALVLSASWLSRGLDEDGNRRTNVRGVALVLALANYLKKYSMWSKDIVFLISDGYIEGTQAWLGSYHGFGQTNLDAEQLSLTTGPIWAALNIDYPHHSFSHVGLFYEGVNGHLPNLDFINAASHILKHSGITPILHSDTSLSDLSPSIFANTPLSFLDTRAVQKYERAAKNLVTQLSLGAAGRAGGPEGVYGRYRIDAITFFGIPAEGPHGFHTLGRAIESTFRSLNNLLERFHQSFFLYLMTSVDSFISVGNYLAAPVLVSAGMTVMGLTVWSESGGLPKSATGLKSGGVEVRWRKPVGKALTVMAATHGIGVGLLMLGMRLDPTADSHPLIGPTVILTLLFTPLLLSALSLLSPSPLLTPTVPLSTTLQSLSLILGGLTIAIVSTLNFGTAISLSLLALPLSLSRPIKNDLGSRVQQFLLVGVSPPVVWVLWRVGEEREADRWVRERMVEWWVVGGWSAPLVMGVAVPLLLQAATAALV